MLWNVLLEMVLQMFDLASGARLSPWQLQLACSAAWAMATWQAGSDFEREDHTAPGLFCGLDAGAVHPVNRVSTGKASQDRSELGASAASAGWTSFGEPGAERGYMLDASAAVVKVVRFSAFTLGSGASAGFSGALFRRQAAKFKAKVSQSYLNVNKYLISKPN